MKKNTVKNRKNRHDRIIEKPFDSPDTYLGKKMQDPEFRRLCEESKLRIGLAIEIARLRHEKRVTQKQLAKLIDSNQAVVSRIENGQENLSLDKLSRIAHALGVKVELKFV